MYEALCYQCMRTDATAARGFKLLVYEAFSLLVYEALGVRGLKLLSGYIYIYAFYLATSAYIYAFYEYAFYLVMTPSATCAYIYIYIYEFYPARSDIYATVEHRMGIQACTTLHFKIKSSKNVHHTHPPTPTIFLIQCHCNLLCHQ